MSTRREDKKRYKLYKARKQQLPASHLEVIDAVERYALRLGPATGDAIVTMLEDLIDIVEAGAKDGTSVREIVGDDPVRFAEEFLGNYPTSPWVAKEQERLASTVEVAARGSEA